MKSTIAAITLVFALIQPASAATGPSVGSWQKSLIYSPSAAVLKREKKGFVFKYDGLTDAEVDEILDDKFERIENMMFTRVVVTDSAGEVLLDPVTGEPILEEDGCD